MIIIHRSFFLPPPNEISQTKLINMLINNIIGGINLKYRLWIIGILFAFLISVSFVFYSLCGSRVSFFTACQFDSLVDTIESQRIQLVFWLLSKKIRIIIYDYCVSTWMLATYNFSLFIYLHLNGMVILFSVCSESTMTPITICENSIL